MLRRLSLHQPDSFAFTAENRLWAEAQIRKYPEGRQASAVIPLLWRAQEQEGWLSRPAIEEVADMLGMARIRALEVATFYFMYQLEPVGRIAHVQVCGTLSCMLCGSGELIALCRERINPEPHRLSADGAFSWEEVECLGACANAPMVQIGKDYYEDLTATRLGEILDELRAGRVPRPGPQDGRFGSEPKAGLTSLTLPGGPAHQHNASVALALEKGDTVRRIDGSEEPLVTPWLRGAAGAAPAAVPDTSRRERGRAGPAAAPPPAAPSPAAASPAAAPADLSPPAARKPEGLAAARGGRGDDLRRIIGVGPKLEALLHSLGFWHFDQIAGWSAEEIAWVDENLPGFRGRVTRDKWVAQAKALAGGASDEELQKIR